MKKFLILAIITLFAASCSTDEPLQTLENYPVEGTVWKLHEIVTNGETDVLSECDLNNSMTLYIDGAGVKQDYYYSDGEICTASEPLIFTYSITDDKFNIHYFQHGQQKFYSETILFYDETYITLDVSERFAGADNDMEVIVTYKRVQ